MLREIPPEAIAAMPASVLKSLRPDQIAALSSEQLAALSPAQLEALSSEQLAAISGEALNAIAPEMREQIMIMQVGVVIGYCMLPYLYTTIHGKCIIRRGTAFL